jgi:hypothetical protein
MSQRSIAAPNCRVTVLLAFHHPEESRICVVAVGGEEVAVRHRPEQLLERFDLEPALRDGHADCARLPIHWRT